MKDRELIRIATEACAKGATMGRKKRRKLAQEARKIIKSKHGIARALEKSDADISRSEGVALSAMIKIKRMIDSGETVRTKSEQAAIRAEMVAAYSEGAENADAVAS